jgi:hypothetical protein
VRSPVVAAFALVALAACGPIEPGGTLGGLREVGFWYRDTDSSGPIPDGIGVGAGFSIGVDTGSAYDEDYEDYEDYDDYDDYERIVLSSSDPRKLERLPRNTAYDGTYHPDFRALAAGVVNINATRTDEPGAEPVLVDYITVRLVEVDRIEVRACDRGFNAIREPGATHYSADCLASAAGTGAYTMISRGASLAPTFCVVPFDDGRTSLGGHFEIQWEQSPAEEQRLQINVSESNRCATIGGLKLGAATVTARLESHSVEIAFTVEP